MALRKILAALLIAAAAVGTSQAQETTVEPEVTAEITDEPVVTGTPAATLAPTATSAPSGLSYVVSPGDTLFRIAQRFGTTVSILASANNITNPSLIYYGQRLIIPDDSATPTATTTAPATSQTPTAITATPTSETNPSYTVRAGDTLYRIALRNTTTVTELARLNNIANTNLIFVGQRLSLPSAVPSTESDQDRPESTVEARMIPDADFAYGIEVFYIEQDVSALSSLASQLGVSWIKLVADWRSLQQAEASAPNFAALDNAVDAFSSNGFSILLTITGAPDWARAEGDNLEEDGPPAELADFGTFAALTASRYAGKVSAYEIWSQQNLRREWNSTVYPIRADHYANLLEAGYNAIKNADADAMVITGGLAPTGYNDGLNAIDDRVYLQDMYSNDVDEFSDAIGANPNGWANPPDAQCCEASTGVETHFESSRFFFLDTLDEYREIMDRNNAEDTAIWVTSFGWGTSEDALVQPDGNSVFLTYTSPQEQAIYIPRAFEIASELGFVGPMILSNLNACPAGIPESCYYSLIDASSAARLAFGAVQAIDKDTIVSSPSPAEQASPTATMTVPVTATESILPTATASASATPEG